MKQKHQIHAVATDKSRNNNQVVQNQAGEWAYTIVYEYERLTLMTSEGAMGDAVGIKRFELYITSDEEIKEGDWYYSLLSETIGQAAPNARGNVNLRKIVATTNPELWDDIEARAEGKTIAYALGKMGKIPTSLIEYFVEMQGNVKEVMVEYEAHNIGGGFGLAHSQPLQTTYKPLLNPDGTIIWSKVEERMYTREEFRKGVNDIANLVAHKSATVIPPGFADHWFDRNYPEGT